MNTRKPVTSGKNRKIRKNSNHRKKLELKDGRFKGTALKTIVAVLVVMLVGLQFRLWAGEGSFAHVNGLGQKVEHAGAVNQVKEQRNKVLRAEIRDLKSGYDSIEEKARVELGFIKEGETFFMLVEQEEP